MAEDLQSKAAEMMKKVLTVGVGAIFLTEESLRGLMTEWKLPKELLAGILESSRKTKNEFLQGLSSEMISKLAGKVDPSALAQELLANNELEFHVKLSFKPKKRKSDEE